MITTRTNLEQQDSTDGFDSIRFKIISLVLIYDGFGMFHHTQWVTEPLQTTGSLLPHILAEYRNMGDQEDSAQTTGSYFRHMVDQVDGAVNRKFHKRSGSFVLVRPLADHFYFPQKNKPKPRRHINYTSNKTKHSNNDVP